MKRFIAIAGNIGVGKSSLTALLSQRLGWQPFYEAVEDNPYLADFYADMPRWAFHSQLFFLSSRLKHLKQILDNGVDTIQDRSVYEDAEIFAANLYRQGLISERDWRTYRSLYEAMTAFLPTPDLIVYLKASTETLLQRIQHRGRAFERSISPEYLARLNTLYDEWEARFNLCPMLTIPADDLDFVWHDAHLEMIATRIVEKLASKETLQLK